MRIKFFATSSYIFFIVLINALIVYLPGIHVFGQSFTLADLMIGLVYLVRDFAQREIKHYIFLAMLIGGALSFFLASPALAIASVSAFLVGELIDWAIFTFTKRPLSKRLILSAILSSPFDSLVFLGVSGRLHLLPFAAMTIGKVVGVFLLWGVWRVRSRKLFFATA